jgi:ABC-type nitrate/sulfonate/bicarbonate transport system permease component
MDPKTLLCAFLLVLSLTGCGKPEPPPSSPQLAEVIKERDRERAGRIEAEAARHKAESLNTSLMFGAALGCAVALFAGIALGSSARMRSSHSAEHHRGQANE